MISSYPDALQYLYENLPMFQRVGAIAYKKDLGNTLKLCEILGNPQKKFKSIHVAGTNGKGSTSHLLASVLQTAGYKTGLYTSPHLKEFTERIKIDGNEITRQFVLDFVNKIEPWIAGIEPSFFEITVAMAFEYFAAHRVDVAVIEVGLGGRLDSTNVITPLVSVITNISWDHKALLGNTLAEIAGEKAGIIKPGIPVVISERQSEVEGVFLKKAELEHAEIFFASDEYRIVEQPVNGTIDVIKDNKKYLDNVAFPLQGFYQRKNLPGVMKTISLLKGHFAITPAVLQAGLENVLSNTRLKGRWQVISQNPTVICDTAHNAAGVSEVMQQLASLPFRKLHIIWGMVKDKEAGDILALLPKHAQYYFCQASIPRALDAEQLRDMAKEYGLAGTVVPDVKAACNAAIAAASRDDMVFIGGSTFVVAEIDGL
jgi:dihydrofolate synthase/folylpolyglutamate synthase